MANNNIVVNLNDKSGLQLPHRYPEGDAHVHELSLIKIVPEGKC